MTINMDGTAIMQVVATVFIAGCAGYTVTPAQLVVVALLALLASVGTPAAPGAGAVILFTILSGAGFVNDSALLAYSLILAINRPIEMLVTSLNVVGDAVASICVAKSEKSSFLQTAQSRRRGFTPILRPHGFGPGGCGGRIRPFPVNRKREKEP